ncbi:MAG: hypothetical protein Q7R64_03830 [bacterium]|nr:hypothetical protein [bacterium]
MKYQKKKSLTRLFHVPCSMFHRGFSLVEVVVGTSLILLSLTGLTTAYSFYLKAGLTNMDNLKSAFLLQEGVEAVTLMRDDAWSNLSSLPVDTAYYLSWNGAKWATSTTEVLVDTIFTRTVKLSSVYRKTAGQDIVDVSAPDPKALDGNAKKLVVSVSWGAAPNRHEREMVTYLTNLFE